YINAARSSPRHEDLKMKENEIVEHAGLDSAVFLRIYILGFERGQIEMFNVDDTDDGDPNIYFEKMMIGKRIRMQVIWFTIHSSVYIRWLVSSFTFQFHKNQSGRRIGKGQGAIVQISKLLYQSFQYYNHTVLLYMLSDACLVAILPINKLDIVDDKDAVEKPLQNLDFNFSIDMSNGCGFAASGNSITVVNSCKFTVWPGISGKPALNITGFELTEGKSRSLHTPDMWSGHVWGRTGCTINGSGHWSCATGDCGTGEMECNGQSYKPPVTIAEINISIYRDTYDVSIMNGFNLPMTVQLTSRQFLYKKMGCVNDLNQECPPDLQLEGGRGCNSACQVFPSSPDYCCHNEVRTCTPTSYGQLFHSVCPKSVTYEYDRSDSMVVTYGGDDYTVIFCDTFSTIKLGGQLPFRDQLVSLGGNFTLGFFDEDGSYLGIWYTSDPKSRKVWVANRNKIESTLGHALSIDPNTGNLIIIDGSRTLMTITNIDAEF
ncbi:G-type lectin S-receptor-like serine/threonine-protein kinase, partial [Tanacetum coccineum]